MGDADSAETFWWAGREDGAESCEESGTFGDACWGEEGKGEGYEGEGEEELIS